YRWSEEDRERITAWTDEQGWEVRYFPWDKWTQRTAEERDEVAYRKQVHAGQFTALQAWADERGYSRRVTGMRCAEGGSRRVMLAANRGESANTLPPLWNWSTEAVRTYLVRHDIPWHSPYDQLGPHARNGLSGKNGTQQGRLVYLKP